MKLSVATTINTPNSNGTDVKASGNGAIVAGLDWTYDELALSGLVIVPSEGNHATASTHDLTTVALTMPAFRSALKCSLYGPEALQAELYWGTDAADVPRMNGSIPGRGTCANANYFLQNVNDDAAFGSTAESTFSECPVIRFVWGSISGQNLFPHCGSALLGNSQPPESEC